MYSHDRRRYNPFSLFPPSRISIFGQIYRPTSSLTIGERKQPAYVSRVFVPHGVTVDRHGVTVNRPEKAMVPCVAALLLAHTVAAAPAVTIRGGKWVNASGEVEILTGANVVVKGAPWLPSIHADGVCVDRCNDTTPTNPGCSSPHHTTTACRTFSSYDTANLKANGYNMIRLGVTWAGAQPTNAATLDPAWVSKLQDILRVCHAAGIRVILDMHEDAVGAATCGEGVPMWFSHLATPGQIGKPLITLGGKVPGGLPLKDGRCTAKDTASWAAHAGTDEYPWKNVCCQHAYWPNFSLSFAAQRTMGFLVDKKGCGFWPVSLPFLVPQPTSNLLCF